MPEQKPKTPAESAVEARYIVMPHQANPTGTAFGAVIMGWIDMVAAMAAQKHCQQKVVTAQVDSMIFKEPINIGDHVVLRACVNYVGTTSMEVGVQVTRENPYTGQAVIATTAHITFVALDENSKPTPCPALEPKTETEKRRWQNAKVRVKTRKQLRKRIRKE